MVAVDQACQLMEQALAILDANGAHQSAALLDSAILALPGAGKLGTVRDPADDELGDAARPS